MNLEIGVIRREAAKQCLAPPTVVQSNAFAAKLAQRYAAHAITVSRADLALAWQPHSEINYFRGGPRIEISPEITIQDGGGFGGLAREIAALPQSAPGFGEAEASALFRRLFSRHARVATFLPPPAVAAPAAVRPDPAFADVADQFVRPAVVERALPRPAPTQAITAPSATAAEVRYVAREMEWGSPSRLPTESKTTVLPAPEVRRVADQVMRELDHRIAAQRERLGRR